MGEVIDLVAFRSCRAMCDTRAEAIALTRTIGASLQLPSHATIRARLLWDYRASQLSAMGVAAQLVLGPRP